jgi:hypothetical protein
VCNTGHQKQSPIQLYLHKGRPHEPGAVQGVIEAVRYAERLPRGALICEEAVTRARIGVAGLGRGGGEHAQGLAVAKRKRHCRAGGEKKRRWCWRVVRLAEARVCSGVKRWSVKRCSAITVAWRSVVGAGSKMFLGSIV